MQPEEECAEPFVGGGEEQKHDRERSIHEPVRHRPVLSRKAGEARAGLVRLGVASDIGPRIADRQDDHRSREKSVQRPLPGEELRVAGHLEELPGLCRTFEHEQVDPLAEARRRPADSDAQHPVQDVGRHWPARVAPRHLPPSDDLTQFHDADANGPCSLEREVATSTGAEPRSAASLRNVDRTGSV